MSSGSRSGFGQAGKTCALLVFAFGLAAVTWWWWRARSYERPPQTSESTELRARTSSIVLPIVISLTDLQSKVNAAVPATLFSIDQGMNGCVPAKRAEVCVIPNVFTGGCSQWLKTDISPAIDCHLSGSITRRSAISIGGAKTDIKLSMPVNASVTAVGRGEIGRNISVTASADSTLTSVLKFDVDENWKPSANVNEAIRRALSYDFSEKYRELLKAANASLTRQLTPELYLVGQVDELMFDSVVADSTGLTAVINAHGQLAIRSGTTSQMNAMPH